MFWWNVIKRIIGEMRSSEELFIINKKSRLFVLQSEDELTNYKNATDRHISYLNEMKAKATDWVKKKKWADL